MPGAVVLWKYFHRKPCHSLLAGDPEKHKLLRSRMRPSLELLHCSAVLNVGSYLSFTKVGAKCFQPISNPSANTQMVPK